MSTALMSFIWVLTNSKCIPMFLVVYKMCTKLSNNAKFTNIGMELATQIYLALNNLDDNMASLNESMNTSSENLSADFLPFSRMLIISSEESSLLRIS